MTLPQAHELPKAHEANNQKSNNLLEFERCFAQLAISLMHTQMLTISVGMLLREWEETILALYCIALCCMS
jgi:hypothetical protein